MDKLAITIITDNYYDALRPDGVIGKRFRSTVEKSIHAEHGLSYFVETVSGGQTNTFMFDYGVDARGVMRNMEVLGISLDKVDALGLSHGHWDHWGALMGILKANQGKIPHGTPFYVGEEAFSERFSVRPGSEPRSIGKLDRQEMESLGLLKIVEVKVPTEVVKGGYYTGRIERVTDYEKVPASFYVKRGDKLERDQFPGEQALFFIVKGKGLVVLAGCAHPGIVNTVRHVQKDDGGPKGPCRYRWLPPGRFQCRNGSKDGGGHQGPGTRLHRAHPLHGVRGDHRLSERNAEAVRPEYGRNKVRFLNCSGCIG